MKVILIEEDRFADLVSTLELERHKLEADNTAERLGWDKSMWRAALDEAHRRYHYHYHYVKWAQSHGASCVRS